MNKNNEQLNMNIDISKMETLKCEKCNNPFFNPTFIIKKVPAIMSPTGKESIVPIQIFSCGNCGEVNSFLNKNSNDTDGESKTENNTIIM